eukprot:TRINITY_DN44645_c0_g1_i1.p2 TRINITY_DN44645_c0_g1~~TRINITY_DN44645_c0_g1_i1.p2  ORF type:complete len:210 (+),score=37.91 TRINITY_DN44645_c0_g1_i1:66-632(+)
MAVQEALTKFSARGHWTEHDDAVFELMKITMGSEATTEELGEIRAAMLVALNEKGEHHHTRLSRPRAAIALGELSKKNVTTAAELAEIRPALLLAAKDEEVDVRVRVAAALGDLATNPATTEEDLAEIRPVVKAILDENMQSENQKALGMIPSPDQCLVQAAQDKINRASSLAASWQRGIRRIIRTIC